ncbi:IS1 family transposase [Thiolinea disciformis]|uniref:IS1 family transposase n=1 Tax=Thiolinea disciformis TaxID=125614 RepID=UPI0009FE398A
MEVKYAETRHLSLRLNLKTGIERLAPPCFSKPVKIHDKVMGTCIEKYLFSPVISCPANLSRSRHVPL